MNPAARRIVADPPQGGDSRGHPATPPAPPSALSPQPTLSPPVVPALSPPSALPWFRPPTQFSHTRHQPSHSTRPHTPPAPSTPLLRPHPPPPHSAPSLSPHSTPTLRPHPSAPTLHRHPPPAPSTRSLRPHPPPPPSYTSRRRAWRASPATPGEASTRRGNGLFNRPVYESVLIAPWAGPLLRTSRGRGPSRFCSARASFLA